MFNTDLDLADYFSIEVVEPYTDGVEFLTALPSYALVRFRVATEAFCHRLHERHGVDLEQPKLYESINLLHRAGVISNAVRDRLHRVRIICNQSVHHRGTKVEDDKGDDRSEDEARQVRDELLAAFTEIYARENLLTEQVVVEKAVNDVQKWKSLLFQAMTEQNPKLKFKAGLWCEGEAARFFKTSPNISVPEGLLGQINQMSRIAACLFLAAWKQDPSHVEAMYRYAKMVEIGRIDGDRKEESHILIKNAADHGLAEACCHYGFILFEEEKDFSGALRYLNSALTNGHGRAHFGLARFFLDEENPDRNVSRAIEHYEKGVIEDDRSSLYELGRILWEGKLVRKDRERARRLISKAAEMGERSAQYYKSMELDGGTQQIMDELKAVSKIFLDKARYLARAQPPGTRRLTDQQKLGANAPCHCGSGRKYKRCHRDKDWR